MSGNFSVWGAKLYDELTIPKISYCHIPPSNRAMSLKYSMQCGTNAGLFRAHHAVSYLCFRKSTPLHNHLLDTDRTYFFINGPLVDMSPTTCRFQLGPHDSSTNTAD